MIVYREIIVSLKIIGHDKWFSFEGKVKAIKLEFNSRNNDNLIKSRIFWHVQIEFLMDVLLINNV